MARPWLRDPEKERLWRARLRAWRQSGLDGRAFCRREGLSLPSFYAWRRELAQRDREVSALSAGAVPIGGKNTGGKNKPLRARRPPKPAARFVPLAVVADAPATIEIVLPRGVLLRVKPAVDRRTLREVLAALAAGEASC